MESNNMASSGRYGIPIDPKDPSRGLLWKDMFKMNDEDFDKIEEFFIHKRDGLKPTNKELLKKISELEKEIAVSDILLKDRELLLSLIPECPSHGKCMPHAIDWINKMKSLPCNP